MLCFTIGAHRIYAGKYISGIVQMALIAGACIWAFPMINRFMMAVNTMATSVDIVAVDLPPVSMLPLLVVLAVGFWVAVDASLLLRGRFTDGKGNKITRWI